MREISPQSLGGGIKFDSRKVGEKTVMWMPKNVSNITTEYRFMPLIVLHTPSN